MLLLRQRINMRLEKESCLKKKRKRMKPQQKRKMSMSQHPRKRGTNLPKTSAKRNAMRQLPDSSKPSSSNLPSFNLSELKSPRFENSIPAMSETMNTLDGLNLNSQAPLGMESLLKDIGTSENLDETEPAEPAKKKVDRFTRLQEGFNEQFTQLGVLVCAFSQDDGLVIVQRADPLSKKLVDVARQNPAVYKALKKYMDGSVYMMLAEELITISLAIMANHGINPVAALLEKMSRKKKDTDGSGNDQLSAVA